MATLGDATNETSVVPLSEWSHRWMSASNREGHADPAHKLSDRPSSAQKGQTGVVSVTAM